MKIAILRSDNVAFKDEQLSPINDYLLGVYYLADKLNADNVLDFSKSINNKISDKSYINLFTKSYYNLNYIDQTNDLIGILFLLDEVNLSRVHDLLYICDKVIVYDISGKFNEIKSNINKDIINKVSIIITTKDLPKIIDPRLRNLEVFYELEKEAYELLSHKDFIKYIKCKYCINNYIDGIRI
jgi:hypothetical protein